MSVENFKPEIWSQELNFRLRKSLVGMQLTNQDYEGEIAEEGDTVHITRPSAVSVGDYATGSDISIEQVQSSQKKLEITEQKYFAFEIDDVDAVQSNTDLLDPYTEEANYKMADTVDQYIFGLYTGADSSNVVSKFTASASNIYGKLVEAKKLLSKNSVPKDGRWIVLDPDEVALLEQSSEFTAASDLGDEVKMNGIAGRIAGFNVFESNNLTTANDGTDDVRHCPFGHSMAITFAMQFAQIEAQRREKRFADLVKGLNLYGSKVIKPKALGDLRTIQT